MKHISEGNIAVQETTRQPVFLGQGAGEVPKLEISESRFSAFATLSGSSQMILGTFRRNSEKIPENSEKNLKKF